MESQQQHYYYQQNAPSQDTYRGHAQSPSPVVYQPPLQFAQHAQPIQLTQPVQYMQQPHPQCICQQPAQMQQVTPQFVYQQEMPVATSQNRDLGDIVTSVIGDEKIKESMKDEEIKMLKAQLDILDDKLSTMIANQVKRFCF